MTNPNARLCLLLATALVFAACEQKSRSAFEEMGLDQPSPPNERYALLVGIGDYPGDAADLPAPATDLQTMRELLVDRYGFPAANVRVLADGAATRAAVIDSFRSHLGKAGPTGTAVLYFVGHGLQMDRNYSVQDAERRGEDQALYVWGSGEKGSVVLDDEIGALARSLRTKRLLVIVDGCFTGTIMQVALYSFAQGPAPLRREPEFTRMSLGFDAVSDQLEFPATFVSDGSPGTLSGDPLADLGGAVLLAATRDEAEAFSGRDWPAWGESHGVFTYYLTRRLSTLGAATTFEEVVGLTRQDIGNDPCAAYGYCQEPQVLGVGSRGRVTDLLGRPAP